MSDFDTRRTFNYLMGTLERGPTKYRNGPQWTAMDRNGPQWTAMDHNGPQWTFKRPFQTTFDLLYGDWDQKYTLGRFVEGVGAVGVMTSAKKNAYFFQSFYSLWFVQNCNNFFFLLIVILRYSRRDESKVTLTSRNSMFEIYLSPPSSSTTK